MTEYTDTQALAEVREVDPQDVSGSTIRVLVINESGFIREGLCRVIERFWRVEVVGGTCFAHDLIEIAEDLRVDVALIDSQYPSQTGFHAARSLHESGVEVRVVILSVNPSLADVRRAFQAGASGFLLRDAGISDLELALYAAAESEIFLCPTLIKRLHDADGFLKDVNTYTRMPQNRDSIDDLLLEALRLGILHQDY
ncbi:response regulator transcription factor [Halomonas sp. CUBES01]|uniref:Response regulator transcription factor n=1 Tax=Vreelandella gomseomensis TaxID=370766 RepID=A0ABU1GBJ4_9GAMM|nr:MULTISPECIES: response regulator transcription factor [Halomonas]MDR5874833.1 response regulator transcription factor [Halomonas gomseomensis]MEC4767361.1 response regulator transcription factor [Halomonas sp. CUBES01]